MKILLSFLTLLFIFAPLQAQPLKKIPQIREKVAAKMAGAARLAPEQEQGLNQLKKLQDPKNWKRISWQEFLKQNEHAKNREGVCIRLDLQCEKDLCNACPEPIPLDNIFHITQDPINYEELLKNKKLIYIAEANNHDTKAAPLETAKILQAVREANPNAKILLATEFLVWYSPYNVLGTANIENDLLYKYDEYQEYYHYLQCDFPEPKDQELCNSLKTSLQRLEQELRNPTQLLKKAGQKSGLNESDSYAPVFQAADRLGIDQLALDDNITGEDRNDSIGVKLGEYVIRATPKDKIPAWKELQEEYGENARLAALAQFTHVSSWGVLERNRDWARRIKALLPAYDIVLVYAGSGHLDKAYFIDLQPMVGKKDFTNITLYPQEELPQELMSYYQQRQKIAEGKGFSRDEQNWEETVNFDIDANKLFGEPQTELEYDPAKPLWYTIKDLSDFLQENQQTYQPWIEENQRQAEDFPFSATQEINIYLPAN